MKRTLAFLTLALLLPTAATVSYAGEEPGRYVLVPAGDGFLKLDSATGTVSECRRNASDWSCASVNDDVSALKKEVDRLAKEIEALRDRLGRAEASVETPRQPPLPANPSFHIPEAAVDEVTDFIAKLMRRLDDLVRDLKGDETKRWL
jgi:uncharacterized coiled-coil protein SlyX